MGSGWTQELVEIPYHDVVCVLPKAIILDLDGGDDEVALPLSQCPDGKYLEAGSGSGTIGVPRWLALRKGLLK